MWKKLGVICISLIAILSVITISQNFLEAATPTPQFSIEGKDQSIVGSAINTCAWETQKPYLQASTCAVLFSGYYPSQLTMSATVSLNSIPTNSDVQFVFGNAHGGGALLGGWNGTYNAQIHINGAYVSLIGPPVVPNKEVTMTSSYDGKEAKLYIDGELVASLAKTGSIGTPSLNTVWSAGANPAGSAIESLMPQYLDGNIKSLGLWGSALTPSQVKEYHDNLQHLYNPELTFLKDGKSVTALSNLTSDIKLAVANKFDITDKRTSGLNFCILDNNNVCDGMTNDVLDIIDNGDGTIDTKIHKGGSVKVRVSYTETTISGDYIAIGDITLTTKDLTSTYTPIPQEGMTTYEYSKNVGLKTIIGEIAFDNFYHSNVNITLKPSSDITHANDYLNFAPDVPTTTSSPVHIKTVNGNTNDFVNGSLKANTYKFIIEISTGLEDISKEVILIVDKTTPTISFTDVNQKDMKIGDSKYTSTVTTTNTDTLVPGDITYTLSGGINNVLTASYDTTNELGYNISIVNSHSGVGLPVTFDLKATSKETDNFLSVSTKTTKPILAYKELSNLTWAANKSTFSSTDVVSNSVIGTLLANDGVGPFTYEMTTSTDPGYIAGEAADNASFAIVNGSNVTAGVKVDLKTTTNLSIGTYNVQFKVTDKLGKIKYVKAVITVSAQTQSAVDFKDKAGGTILTGTGIKIKYNDDNHSVFAEGGSSGLPIEYYLADQIDQPNSIDPSLYLGINKSNGLLEPLKVGEVYIYAQSPGDGNYSSQDSGFMKVTIEKAVQSVAFNNTTSPSKVGIGDTITEDASGTVTLDNSVGIGGILYTSSDSSIASIDADGKITGVKAGNVTITAILNDPSSSTYDANYETKQVTKTVNVY